MKIVCDAIPFGFGPVAKLLALGRYLKRNFKTVFVGNGCSLTLAMASDCFDRVENVDTLAPDNSRFLAECIKECSGAISIMNPIFAEWVISRGIPTIIVDSLFSMWDKIPPEWHLANALVLQRFDDEEQRVEREFTGKNVRIVGPILDPLVRELSREKSVSGTLLVNLGGAEDPISEERFLCARTISQLFSHLPELGLFPRKVLAVGPKQKDKLLSLEKEGFEVVTLDHTSFLRELAGAALFCTTPGLTATFESFALRVPCVFLPPFNYSQFLNLLAFRQNGAAPLGVHWADYGIGSDIHKGMDEGVAVRRLEHAIRQAIQDDSLISGVRQSFSSILVKASTHVVALSLVSAQSQYFERLGSIGTEDAANYILEVFHG